MNTQVAPLVTIAIPTYNRADGYLREAIGSALAQTYPSIEILVSDNCSSDNTGEVIAAFADTRIRYFRQAENIGANNNFNFLLGQAKGAYFQLLPDDDLIDPDFVETCMRKVAGSTNVGIIQTGTRIIDSGGHVVSVRPNRFEAGSPADYFRAWFAYRVAPYQCSTLVNTEGLREIGGFGSKHNLFQDMLAEVQLAARYGSVGIFDVKASFRKHPESITSASKVNDWCEDSLQLLDVMCDLVPDAKDRIRAEGMRFLARLNYNRANDVKSAARRLAAYFMVFSKFGYRHLPPKDHLIAPVQRFTRPTGETFLKKRI